MRRMVHWSGVDDWRAEVAHVAATPEGLRASGVQMGVEPIPYRLEYALEADPEWRTRRLRVAVLGEGWSRRLDLTADGAGDWRCEAGGTGTADLPEAGGDTAGLAGALDVDLGLSPLTNLLPVRRSGLYLGPGPALDLVAAWVSVPGLAVRPSAQRYENVRAGLKDAVVRFHDLGEHDGFVAELLLDRDGLVVDYPGLARRVTAP